MSIIIGEPACEHCVHGREERTGSVPTVGQRQITCRRYPPTPLALATPQGVQVLNAFPTLAPDASCGEFKAEPL